MTLFSAELLYTPDKPVKEDHYLDVENGVIRRMGPVRELSEEARKSLVRFENAMMVPGFVNSHNHSFQSLLKGFCDDKDFFTWRDQALYKYARRLSEEDLYNGALFAFGEMLKQGITTVCDFFYINDQANDNARTIIRAGRDLGMRIVMARTMYDWDGAPERFRETVDEAVENTRALHAEFVADPWVHVLPAPHSLHGASIEMIQAGAALAEELDTKFHMHIAEGQYERQMMLEKHGKPPITYLDENGVLNERLVGIHCVWLDDVEIKEMAGRGAGLSYNPSSNMFLGDGITRIKEMYEEGICISLGTDGGCSNNRASIIEEMRMTSLLQKVRFHNSTVTTAEQVFEMGTVNGGKNLGISVGKLEEGYFADFAVIDLDNLSMQPRQNATKNLIYAMQPDAIRAVYAGGEEISVDGRICKISERTIVEKVRQTTAGWN